MASSQVFGFDPTRFYGWLLIVMGVLLGLAGAYLSIFGDSQAAGVQAFESSGTMVGTVALIAGLGLEFTGIRLEAMEESLEEPGS